MVTMNKTFILGVTVPEYTYPLYGWDNTLDLGTSGDLFVDGSVASSGDGLTRATAKKTIAEAISVSTGGETIRILAGTYRERFKPKSGPGAGDMTELLGYGTDKPVITGADPLAGFVPCTGADEPVVGPNWASIYKSVGLAKSSIAAGDPIALNIHEDGARLDIATGWQGNDLGDKFYQHNKKDWYTADSTNTIGASPALILSYVDASVTSDYTASQIMNCVLLGHKSPNGNFRTGITSVLGSTITLALQTQKYESNASKDNFVLLNLLPAMERGGWGYVDNGADVDVYVWPNNPASINAGIEYSARVHCVDLGGLNNIRLKGLDVKQSSGAGGSRSGVAIINPSLNKQTNVDIQHCRVSNIYSMFGGNVGIRLVNVDDITLRNVTVENAQGCHGIFISGNLEKNDLSQTQPSTHVDYQYNYINKSERSPFRFYTTRDAVVAFNKANDCGYAAHANKINFYEQCHSILVWGNTWENCDGYATWQETSAIFWMFNYITATGGSTLSTSRSLQDQSNATLPPNDFNGDSVASYVVNNTFIPDPVAIGAGASNGLNVTKSNAASDGLLYNVWNNLYNGHSIDDPSQIASWSGNWNTGPDGFYAPGNISATQTNVWTDPALGDFTIGASSPIRAATGNSLASLIDTILKPRFGDRFNGWEMDCLGREFNRDQPPVGCVANYDYTLM